MYQTNENYLKLPGSYLFSTATKKVAVFTDVHQDKRVIRMDIDDVMKPLCPAVIQALHETVDEVGEVETFRGYGPENGYAFLWDKIVEFDYRTCGAKVRPDEILTLDGAKSGSGNIQEIFSLDPTVVVCGPVYPVYPDMNVTAGWSDDYDAAKGIYAGTTYLPYTAENDLTPVFPAGKVPDLTYLRLPNNPTGAIMRKEALQRWMDYTNENGGVVLFDVAYGAYITKADILHTIYKYGGAKTCAIELHSFSKKADFTGLRLGATAAPYDLRKKVKCTNDTTEEAELHAL